MNAVNRCAKFLAAMCLFVIAAAVLPKSVTAQQEETWRVTRADYGFKSQRTDVTDLVGDLISRGGVNGRVAVVNQTMGGDPAVGKDKSLRIFATNRRNEERVFTYQEGGFIEARMFVVRNNDWDDRDSYYGDRNRGSYSDRNRSDWNSFRVIRGFYGIQGKTTNVTDRLRDMTRDGRLTVSVNNSAMGGDPAIGAEKMLIVIYRYQGKEQATFVREGNMLSLP